MKISETSGRVNAALITKLYVFLSLMQMTRYITIILMASTRPPNDAPPQTRQTRREGTKPLSRH